MEEDKINCEQEPLHNSIEYKGAITVEEFDEFMEGFIKADPNMKGNINFIRQTLYPENILIL